MNNCEYRRLSVLLQAQNSNVLRLGPNNDATGWFNSLSNAWDSGAAFAIEVRSDVYPLDLDSPEDLAVWSLLHQEVEEVDGLEYLVCTSGTGDNRHVWIASRDHQSDCTLTQLLNGRLRPVANRHGQRMRPPGSPSAKWAGVSSDLVFASEGFLAALRQPERVCSDPRGPLPVLGPPLLRRSVEDLPAGLQEELKDGGYGRFDGQRHRWDLSMVRQLMLAGWSLEDVTALALRGTHEFSDKARELGLGAERYLERTYRTALTSHLSHQRPTSKREALELLGDYRRLAELAGTRDLDPSDRMALLGVIELFTDFGGMKGHASVRDVSQRCGLSENTAAKALKRLVADGWIHQLEAGSARTGMASEYRLVGARFTTLISTSLGGLYLRVSESVQTPIGHPAFYHQALGPVAHLLVCHLSDEISGLDGLTRRSGLGRRTVQKHLSRLTEAGAVEKADGLFRVRPNVSWDCIACSFGTIEIKADRDRRRLLQRKGLALFHAGLNGSGSSFPKASRSPTAGPEPADLNSTGTTNNTLSGCMRALARRPPISATALQRGAPLACSDLRVMAGPG